MLVGPPTRSDDKNHQKSADDLATVGAAICYAGLGMGKGKGKGEGKTNAVMGTNADEEWGLWMQHRAEAMLGAFNRDNCAKKKVGVSWKNPSEKGTTGREGCPLLVFLAMV